MQGPWFESKFLHFLFQPTFNEHLPNVHLVLGPVQGTGVPVTRDTGLTAALDERAWLTSPESLADVSAKHREGY